MNFPCIERTNLQCLVSRFSNLSKRRKQVNEILEKLGPTFSLGHNLFPTTTAI